VQAGLHLCSIQQPIVFAVRDIREACQIGDDRPGAILAIQTEEGVLWQEIVRLHVRLDHPHCATQFLSILTVARIAKAGELCGIKTDMSRVIELAHPFPLGFLLSAVFPIQPYAF